MSERIKCNCGCNSWAVYWVESEEYTGEAFREPCCESARVYLGECATEFNKPYKQERIIYLSDGTVSEKI